MFSTSEPQEVDDRTCSVCREHDYQQRMTAQIVECAWCEEQVCEDCAVQVSIVSPGGLPMGWSWACIDCVDD